MREIVEEPWFDALLLTGRRIHFPAGQTFHHAGDPLPALNVIISGQVELWHIAKSGQEVWLGTCQSGDVVDTSTLIPQTIGEFDMVALTNVALLSLTHEAFQNFAKQFPDFADVVVSRVANLLNQSRTALIKAQTLPATGRIESELLRLSDPIGIDPDKRIIRPNPVFADLARRAGTTRETVSRTVNAMCKSGVLERQPGALVVMDAAKLG
jgi:CRP/FNR family cyclic AMP-dependent transcriptional regulator